MTFASVPEADWIPVQGEQAIRPVKSSSFGHRLFCGECGTPLLMKVNHQHETVDISITTLDEPHRVQPGFHIFWASRMPWFPDDDLPKFDRFRPDTRGLNGTEPPG